MPGVVHVGLLDKADLPDLAQMEVAMSGVVLDSQPFAVIEGHPRALGGKPPSHDGTQALAHHEEDPREFLLAMPPFLPFLVTDSLAVPRCAPWRAPRDRQAGATMRDRVATRPRRPPRPVSRVTRPPGPTGRPDLVLSRGASAVR